MPDFLACSATLASDGLRGLRWRRLLLEKHVRAATTSAVRYPANPVRPPPIADARPTNDVRRAARRRSHPACGAESRWFDLRARPRWYDHRRALRADS